MKKRTQLAILAGLVVCLALLATHPGWTVYYDGQATNFLLKGFMDIPEQSSAPGDPSINTARLYVKDDGNSRTSLYFKDYASREIELVPISTSNYTYETFKSNPTASSDSTPFTPAQYAGQTSFLSFGPNNFEWNVKVTPSVTTGGVPKLIQTGGSEAAGYTSTGLDIAVGAISGDGYELTQGYTDNAKHIFTIGTSEAFFIKAKIYLADASGAITAVAGFRSVTDITADGSRGYTGTFADYPEYAAIGKDTGATIKISTELREGGQVTTDTTNTWRDEDTAKTLEVYVSSAGVVTYKIDGSAPTTTAAFTFTSGIKVIPFFWITHGSDICEYATIESWECGYQ